MNNCPKCESDNLVKIGYDKYNRQRYHCKNCGFYSTEGAKRNRDKKDIEIIPLKAENRFHILKQRNFFESLKIKKDKAMVISDAHIPLHDKKLFNIMLNVAQEKDIRTLICDGDLLNVDAFSYFDQKVPEESLARDFSWERMEVEEALSILEKNFDEIIVNVGNHEINRLMAVFKGSLNLRDIFKLFTNNIKQYDITNRDHIILTSGNNKWRICHPKNYSQIKGRISYRLADKYQMNIISAHGHFCGMNISLNGKYIVIDSGGLFDTKKIAYIQNTNTYPEWNQGFLTIDNSYPDLFNPLYKDLSRWE